MCTSGTNPCILKQWYISFLFQLPRMNIVDWKPGSLGIPTFHCKRCMNNWLRKGDLPKDCCEPEDITEGPAMCITFTDQASSEMMIVGGIVGEDGKPVRIKVGGAESIRKLLKRKAKERHMRKQRRARKKREECKRSTKGDIPKDGETEESNGEVEYEFDSDCSSSSSEEEVLNLPKLFQKYILKKAGRKHRYKRNTGRDSELASGEESSLAFITSSFSSASWDSSGMSHVSSTEHDHHDKKYNATVMQRRHRSKGNSKKEAKSSCDGEGSACSSEDDIDSTCSSPRPFTRRKTKPKLSREDRTKCSSKRHAPQVSRVDNQSTSAKSGKRKNQSKIRHGNYDDETHMPNIDHSRGTSNHQNGQLTSGADGIVDINHKTHYNSANSGGFQLPSITDASSHSTVTRKQRRTFGGSLHLPQLSQASMQQRTQDQLVSDSHVQLHSRRQSTLCHDITNMRENGNNITKGSKLVSNFMTTSTSHFSMENATCDQLLNPAQQRRGSQINPNYASVSPGKSPQANSTGLTKIATVREDVHIAAGSQHKGRLKQVRKKKKSQMAHKETPHIRSSDVGGEEATTHITLPLNAATADKVHVDTQLELQKHRGPTSTDDGHAKRIGQKIIKKTRKSTNPQSQASVNHNSKDLGYLMEKADVDAGFRLPKGSATSDRRNSLRTICSNDEMSSSDSRMIPSSAKTSTTGLLSGRPGTARQIEHSIFMPPTGSSPRPNSTKFGDAELYSGLGTKFTRGTSAAYQKLPLALVQNCLVEMPAKEQFMVGKTTVLPPITEANTGGDNSCLPISTSQAPCHKMETDSGLEVSTEEECSDDEELLPIAELKPISALSFTSAYAYSFFSMAVHHRKVYNITRKKALEPVRLGRSRLLRKKN